MGFLMDTCVWIDVERGSLAPADVAALTDSEPIFISPVTLAELRFGAEKSGSVRLAGQLELVLAALPVLPLQPPGDARYASLRVALERTGEPIGPNDMFIAAHALALRLTLVTGKVREFSRVPSLKVTNWLRADG